MTIEVNPKNYHIWLSTLKVGDKVALTKTTFGIDDTLFTEITKITPKGGIRIKWNDSYLFKDGKTDSGGKWSSTYFKLYPITQKLIDEHKRKVNINNIIKFSNWEGLDNETINTIHALIFKNKPLPLEV